ncbi:response regulator [Clostridium hydrogenum]|uniref:response regulator n=1 Tax=Clostridium hydrogenum TaxID=2855764 RepID=UPI001F46E79B|nr:response regulator [Clostridium hydrogenum]
MYTVLHIETSELFTTMLKTTLDKKGYNYISTDSFKEAFQILYEEDVDLIITSLIAEGSTIENFLESISMSNYSEIPIFLVTSNEMNDEKKKLMNMGVTDYIVKDSFIDEISKHIDVVFQENKYMGDLKEVNIAVLDDSKFELKIEKDIFDKYGIENAHYYNSGKELINSGKKYDIYLIDIVLDHEFGKNIIMNIRRNNINASIIAVTGLTNSKIISSVLAAGADDYITKPIDEKIFIAKLKANVRIYSLNKQVKNLLKEMTKSH